MAEAVFLEQFLRPFRPWLACTDVSEIAVNTPGEVWIERVGRLGMEAHAVAVDRQHVIQLARQVASFTAQAVNEERPLLSATLPTGERIQFVLPPASLSGVLSIRKQVVCDLSLEAYARQGSFSAVKVAHGAGTSDVDLELRALLEGGKTFEFLRTAVRARKNLLLSGGTSSGKTTLLNALAKEIPAYERIVTIEDTRELRLPHANTVSLVASRGDQGDARVSVQDLLEASLRLRPDRILLGELRSAEAYTFLRAVNTGHPGSLSTLHADSPARAFEQLALMVLQAGLGLGRTEILAYVRSVIDVVVQVARTPDGRRIVSEVEFLRA